MRALVKYDFMDVAQGELLRQFFRFAACQLSIILFSLGGFRGIRFLQQSAISGVLVGLLSLGVTWVTAGMVRKIWQTPSSKALKREQ